DAAECGCVLDHDHGARAERLPCRGGRAHEPPETTAGGCWLGAGAGADAVAGRSSSSLRGAERAGAVAGATAAAARCGGVARTASAVKPRVRPPRPHAA